MPKLTLANIQRGLRLVRMLDFDPKASLGPIRVDVSATSACNYRCQFCGSHSPLLLKAVDPESLNLSVIRDLLIDLRQLGTREVLFAGNGEPLLSSAMRRAIEESDGYFRFEILTNGSLLNTVTEFMFSKLAKLTVSLNSGNGDSHQATHGYSGANQFPAIIANIERLLGYKDGQGKIELNYVVTNENKDEAPAFVEMAMRWGVDHHIRPVDSRLFDGTPEAARTLSPCYMGYIHTSVTAGGDVLQCFGCSNQPLGNLYANTFVEIWRSPRARELRLKAASMPQTQKPVTQGCYDCPNARASSEAFDAVYSRIPVLGRRKWS